MSGLGEEGDIEGNEGAALIRMPVSDNLQFES